MTSLVDFYGFRDKGERSVEALQEHLAQEIQKRIPDARRMFPYVQKHELEGLLFSDTTAFRMVALASEGIWGRSRRSVENSIRPKISTTIPKARRARELHERCGDVARRIMDGPLRRKQAWRKSARNAAVSRVVGVLGRIEPKQRIELSMHMR